MIDTFSQIETYAAKSSENSGESQKVLQGHLYFLFWHVIARISKGRTVREFVIFVLLLPTTLCFNCFGYAGVAFSEELVDSSAAKRTEPD